jgi:hypothetical protein
MSLWTLALFSCLIACGGDLGIDPSIPAVSAADAGTPVVATRPEPVFLSIRRSSETVRVEARRGGSHLRTESLDRRRFEARWSRLYQILEEQPSREAELRELIAKLSRTIVLPLAPLLDSAPEIIVIVSNQDLRIPLDLLENRGRALFLDHPVSYRFGDVEESPFEFKSDWRAFIVSDVTADPDRACRFVKELFSGAEYYDHEDVDEDRLSSQDATDVLLMSVHGEIGGEDEDSVGIADEECALARDFLRIRPRIAYFDSCQLGVSKPFLATFRRMGTRYYLGPITSNEAGHSSTETMKRFFGHLVKGESPEHALFLTRRELFELYRDSRLIKRLWYAFPFRVYRLN